MSESESGRITCDECDADVTEATRFTDDGQYHVCEDCVEDLDQDDGDDLEEDDD
jgi:hypothetical protein